MQGERGSVGRYAAAIGAVAVAVALESLRTELGETKRFLLLNGAVLVAAWYGGRRPALVAIALATAAGDYFLIPPYRSFQLTTGAATVLGVAIVEMSVSAALVVAVTESRARALRGEEQLRKLNKAHRALTVSNEALVRAKDDAVLLEEICRAIVEVAEYRMCWVGHAEHDEAKTVRPIARAGHDQGYVDVAEITWANTERGSGPVGTAIRTARPDVRQDIAADPTFAPWRAEALKRGYASVIATPLCDAGQVIGALAIYAPEKDAFDADAVRLLTDLSNDLAYGIAALRARADLATGRARLETTLMQAPVAVAVYAGPDHVVRLANRRWFALGFGIEAVGRPLRESLQRSTADAALAVLDEAYTTGEPREAVEHPILRPRPDGSVETGFYNLACQPLRSAGAAVTDLVVAISDVTAQVTARRVVEEARAAVEQACRSKDEFLRTVSHELRTPLTSVLGFAEALKRSQDVRPDDLQRGLDVIIRNAREEARLVNDLIDVSEIVAGKMRLETLPVELGSIVQACIDEARPTAAAKGIQLDVSIAPDAMLRGDAHRLAQATRTLLSNALKFTPYGGRVSVEVTRKDEVLLLRVDDTGKGIPPGELPYVFEPFRTGDGSLKRAHGGLGLGLYLARHIVEAHGGRVWAESVGDGGGATLVAEIPREKETAQLVNRVMGTRRTSR